MTFSSKDLSVLAYANGFTLWHYTTPDAATAVDNSGYFNGAADMLRVGDMIIANTGVGATPHGALLIVSGSSGGSVSVADLVAKPAG